MIAPRPTPEVTIHALRRWYQRGGHHPGGPAIKELVRHGVEVTADTRPPWMSRLQPDCTYIGDDPEPRVVAVLRSWRVVTVLTA